MTSNDETQEAIEWGIKREPLFVRQRKAINEMEEMKNGRNKQHGNSDTSVRTDNLQF